MQRPKGAERMSKVLFLFVCLLTTIACGADVQQPNVVFILADDLGYMDLACYGHQFHETPVIDQLAKDGIRFTDFYAATPVCSSTRSTIMTGQYSARTGITDFIPGHWRPFEKLVVPKVEPHLKDGLKTIGDVFRVAGYRTGYVGKWHLGGQGHQPQHHGFDVVNGGSEFRKGWGQKRRGPKQIDFFTAAAIKFIEQNGNVPFLLFLSHQAMHIPLQGNPSTVAKYRKKQPAREGINHPVYAAMLEDLDSSVGKILRCLDKMNIAENTILVFTSDNGGLQKIFTGVGETVSTNRPLRAEKGTLYEGGIRVPLIVCWHGRIPRMRSIDIPSTTADLLPTLCEMAKVPLPQQPVDGSSLLPLMAKGQANSDWSRDAIFFHYPHYHHSRPAGAIRSGDWKLIEFFDDGSLELYNVVKDMSESSNLANRHVDQVERLHQRLIKWRKETGARMPQPNPDHDPKRAAEWWSRGTGKPIDLEAMRKHYNSK